MTKAVRTAIAWAAVGNALAGTMDVQAREPVRLGRPSSEEVPASGATILAVPRPEPGYVDVNRVAAPGSLGPPTRVEGTKRAVFQQPGVAQEVPDEMVSPVNAVPQPAVPPQSLAHRPVRGQPGRSLAGPLPERPVMEPAVLELPALEPPVLGQPLLLQPPLPAQLQVMTQPDQEQAPPDIHEQAPLLGAPGVLDAPRILAEPRVLAEPGLQGEPLVVAVQATQKPMKTPEAGAEPLPASIQLEPPPAEQLFQLISEAALRARLRKEDPTDLSTGYRFLPEEKPVDAPARLPSASVPNVMHVSPHYVCSKLLFFEQPRSERYGRSLGILEPLVAAGVFYFDIGILPARAAAAPWPCRRFECFADGYSPYFSPVYCPELIGTGNGCRQGCGLTQLGLWQ